jgi:adenylate kinase
MLLCRDCSLKLRSMNKKVLVIVDHHATVNMTSGFVHTAHHAREVGLALRL